MEFKKKAILYLIVLFTIFNVNWLMGKAIIWDLGGTLVDTSRFGIARNIGLFDLFIYNVSGGFWKNSIQDDVFNCLDAVSVKNDYRYKPKSADGKILPGIMVDWLEGKILGSCISSLVKNSLDRQISDTFFTAQRNCVIQNTVDAIFNPEILAHNIYVIKPALYLLDKCSKNNKNNLFILSNFDPSTFEIFKNTNSGKRVLRYFKDDHVILSGYEKVSKPNPEIYNALLKRFELIPKDCVFIDDQYENIEMARSLGFDAMHLNNQDYYSLQKQLEARNLI